VRVVPSSPVPRHTISGVKVVLAPAGSRGDVAPFLALAGGLRARGHDVLLCAAPNYESWSRAQRIPFRPVGSDLQAVLRSKAAVMVSHPLRVLREAVRLLREETAAYSAALLEAGRGADLVVGTVSLVGGPSAAQACGARYRCLICCPTLIPSRRHPPLFVPYRMLPGWLNASLWTLTAATTDLALRGLINTERRALGLEPVERAWDHCLTSSPILAADPVLAPSPGKTRFAIAQTGALLFHEPLPLDRDLEEFLSAGPRPVYVGFGSMPDPDPQSTVAILTRIVRSLGLRALISSGWAGLAATDQPDIRVIGEAPHARLFPRVMAVVHHGGAGTTATAARAGVPQIVIPHLLDQHYWGRRISDLGLGLAPTTRREMNEEKLKQALRRCVEDPSYRERAATLARELRTDGLAATIDELERGQR
jgi:vancomycin aglycone glucosyltransferase